MTIKEYLKQYKLITDGSFGTYYSSTYQTYDMPEAANLDHPDRVSDIHTSYIESGARLIRTNTFASNTVLLNSSMEDIKQNLRQPSDWLKRLYQNLEKKSLSPEISAQFPTTDRLPPKTPPKNTTRLPEHLSKKDYLS